jgi:hypothetical protein
MRLLETVGLITFNETTSYFESCYLESNTATRHRCVVVLVLDQVVKARIICINARISCCNSEGIISSWFVARIRGLEYHDSIDSKISKEIKCQLLPKGRVKLTVSGSLVEKTRFRVQLYRPPINITPLRKLRQTG